MKFDEVKDSGAREDMSTGSRRDTQEGKSRPDLMNPLVLRRLGQHFANGCDKYGEKNFELGQLSSRYRASLGRHMLDYDEGLRDEDHLSAIIWNAMCIMMNQEFVERGIYPVEIHDFSDYTDKAGFRATVGARAMAHNEKLRKAEQEEAEDLGLDQKQIEHVEPTPAVVDPIDKTGFCFRDFRDDCIDCMCREDCLKMISQGYLEKLSKSIVEPVVERLEDWNTVYGSGLLFPEPGPLLEDPVTLDEEPKTNEALDCDVCSCISADVEHDKYPCGLCSRNANPPNPVGLKFDYYIKGEYFSRSHSRG